MVHVNPLEIGSILQQLENTFGSLGFEFQPFKQAGFCGTHYSCPTCNAMMKLLHGMVPLMDFVGGAGLMIGWYNSFIKPIFKLNYEEDTVAFLLISSPRMFENAFIPFLQTKQNQLLGLKDPIDECMLFYLSKIPKIFSDYSVRVVHDFELHSNRRPRVIMQSAAHASGTAYFYHPDSIYLDLSGEKKKMFGVCVHPKYGGWFAIRAVAIFENLQCPDLCRTPPCNVVPSKEDQIKLLELYNFNWTDWKFRDIIPVAEKYSELQIKYFSAPPGNRGKVVEEILEIYDVIK